MSETLSVFQWSILALAALCIGMSKTGVQGIMLLIVPYMAMAFGAKESTGVILPMLCMADIMAVAYYKRIADWKTVANRPDRRRGSRLRIRLRRQYGLAPQRLGC